MTPAVSVKAGRREWIGLAVLALACIVYAMDLTVLELAVPAISTDLRPTSVQLLWIVDIYGFFVAGLLIPMGTLGDRLGRRRLLMIGAAAFALASVLASLSTSAEMLILTRAILGVAGATVAPSTLSLIRSLFPDGNQRTVAIGVWISSFSAGAVIGPLIGGLALEYFWWGSVFLLGVPVMALLLILGPLLLPEYQDEHAGRIDLISALMSLIAVLAVIYGLKQIAQDGLGWPAIGAVLGGLFVGTVFVLRQSRVDSPLLDLRLFRVPVFSAALATHALAFFAFGGAFFFVAQYLQLVLGLSPLVAGVWTVPPFIGFIIGSTLAPWIVRRVAVGTVMAAGLTIAALGFVLLAQVDRGGLAAVVVGSLVISLGLAPVFTLATDLIVGSAPAEQAGAASGISETGSELGGALGIAVLGMIGVAVYRHDVAPMLPASLTAESAKAAIGTLGGAVVISQQLPAEVSAQLLVSARGAFVHGLQVTAAAGALIAMALVVVVAKVLRRPIASSETGSTRA